MSKSFRNYYHAGLSPITKFNINKGGLHMGGRYSALEAAARKVREMHQDDKKTAKIYLHSVLVDDSSFYEGFDCGSNDLWEAYIQSWLKVGIQGMRYKNLFEPDLRKSIILCCTTPIKEISGIKVLTLDEAESILERMEEQYSYK